MININKALQVSREAAEQTLTDRVRLERLEGQTRGKHGQLVDDWHLMYAGPGLVQNASAGVQTVAGEKPATVASHVAKLPHRFRIDPHKRHRLTIEASLDEATVGDQFEVISDETNGWAILRRLRIERS